MKVRISALVILLMVISNVCTVTAEISVAEEERILSAILPENFEAGAESVSRRDCLIAVMKGIGVDTCTEIIAANSFYTEPVFHDVWGTRQNDGYLLEAGLWGIAVGVRNKRFYPDQNVTVKECLTFMLRCIRGTDAVDFETVLSTAAAEGLVWGGESFLRDVNAPLSAADFKLLLKRMLHHKMGLYWPAASHDLHHKRLQWNTNENISYMELVLQMLTSHDCEDCENGEYLWDDFRTDLPFDPFGAYTF